MGAPEGYGGYCRADNMHISTPTCRPPKGYLYIYSYNSEGYLLPGGLVKRDDFKNMKRFGINADGAPEVLTFSA